MDIIGRDRVVDTSPVWKRKHAARLKGERSIRAPSAARWTVLPIIRSRIREHVRSDSRARFVEYERRAHGTRMPDRPAMTSREE